MKKELSAQQIINRKNRQRGKSFEKNIASLLNWFLVPMSGNNAAMGWGDVKDKELKNDAIYMGECKTITPKNPLEKIYNIQLEWLDKLTSRSISENNKMPVLFFTLFGDTNKFVMIPKDILDIVNNLIPYVDIVYDVMRIKRQSKNHKNYSIPRDYVMDHRFRNIRRAKVNIIAWDFGFEDEVDGSKWAILHLSDFIKFYNDDRMCLVKKQYYAILNRKGSD